MHYVPRSCAPQGRIYLDAQGGRGLNRDAKIAATVWMKRAMLPSDCLTSASVFMGVATPVRVRIRPTHDGTVSIRATRWVLDGMAGKGTECLGFWTGWQGRVKNASLASQCTPNFHQQ